MRDVRRTTLDQTPFRINMAMNSTILKNNVFHKVILGFLSVPILVASVCAIVPDYSVIKVLVFAIIVFVWSLVFPTKLKGQDLTLPGGAVDFWYYSLALFGVLLFFSSNADQRERLRLSEIYNAALERSAELSKDKKLFTDLSNNRDAFFDKITTMAQQRAQQVRELRYECSVNVGQRQLLRKVEDIQRRGGDWTKRLPVDPNIMNHEQAFCDAIFQVSGWGELAATQNYEQLSERATNGTPAESTIVVNGVALALPLVANYIALAPGSKGWTKKMEGLNSEIEKAEQSQAKAANAYRDVGSRIENASFSGKVTNFLWPYILITALGMKLACKPYAYNTVQ